jgi:adenine-specific DNA-methyltransferase
LELYSRLVNECYLTNRNAILDNRLKEALEGLKRAINDNWCSDGFMSELYYQKDDKNIQPGERVFYSRRNAEYLDTARQQISALPEDLQVYFLAPLLSEASVHANTSGVFKGFYKDRQGVGCFGGAGKNALTRILGNIEIDLPVFSNFCCNSVLLQKNAKEAVLELPCVDMAYFDPPYNQHPYGSNYFMLNLLATYEKPNEISPVSGIPLNWNRSTYNQQKNAKLELFEVIKNCKATYVLISYNSEGFVSYEDFVGYLNALGDLRVLEAKYNTFRGSRNLRERDIHVKEYLFLLRKD